MQRRNSDVTTTVRQLDLRDAIRLNLKWIEWCGYLSPEYESQWKRVAYGIYAKIAIFFVYVLYTVSEVANMVAVFGDVERMSDASFLLLTHVVEMLKVNIFLTETARVRTLIDGLNRHEFRPRNGKQVKMIERDVRKGTWISRLSLSTCAATCFLWAFFPLLDPEKRAESTVSLPLSGWYPFSTDTSPIFEMVYIYQSFGALINGMVNTAIDIFMAGMFMLIAGQFALLNNSFQNMDLKMNSVERKKEFVRNINHHRKIVEFATEMMDLFSKSIVLQFIVSSIIICLTLFKMTLVSTVFSLEFLALFLYQGCMIAEIFFWSYFGNEVICESTKLVDSAYFTQWIDSSEDFKDDLLFFMTSTQKPLKLYAGGYFPLSLDTFMAIVKTAWSYFAVLNRVHAKDE